LIGIAFFGVVQAQWQAGGGAFGSGTNWDKLGDKLGHPSEEKLGKIRTPIELMGDESGDKSGDKSGHPSS
jgi:hypothetical protein